tara:strand:- start:2239 stop:2958 length:720 start_codon:yes stop_codon:yes gene_type:complete
MNRYSTKEVSELSTIPLPPMTDSYMPVSHTDLVLSIEKHIPNYWQLQNRNFDMAREGKQMFGVMNYKASGIHNNISIGFRNSYDKSVSVGLCSGAQVIVCSNMMFLGDVVKMRKHTTNVWDDVDDIITQVITRADIQAEQAQDDLIMFEQVGINDVEAAKIIGDAFLNKDIVNGVQLNKIKSSWKDGDYSPHNALDNKFGERTLYALYGAATDALKSSHPADALNNYTELHEHFKEYAI